MSLIVTFYSFKGDVGRSMASANIGVILSQRRVKTLLVDLDLEALGLHKYFKTLKVRPSSKSGGMLDLLLVAGFERNDGEFPDWRDYVSIVNIGQGNNLSLITSGVSYLQNMKAVRLWRSLGWNGEAVLM